MDWSEDKTKGPSTALVLSELEGSRALRSRRSVTVRSAEDRRTGEITTQRMGRAQGPPQAGPGLPAVGGVIDPPVRQIRSVTRRSTETGPRGYLEHASRSGIKPPFFGQTEPIQI